MSRLMFYLGWMVLSGCAKLASPSAPCNNAGYYAGQSECQKNAGSGGCASVMVMAEDQSSFLCWKPSMVGLSTGNVVNTGVSNTQTNTQTQTQTQSNTQTGCNTNQAPPWTMGSWSPASCGPGIQIRTRNVNCSYSCPCAQPQPSSVETCTPNLYGQKHYESECTSAGGVVDWIDGNRVCIFSDKAKPQTSGSSNNDRIDAVCPSGWTAIYSGQHKATITGPRTAEDHINCYGGRATVSTAFHSSFFPAKAIEAIQYCSWRNCFKCKRWESQTALIKKIACY